MWFGSVVLAIHRSTAIPHGWQCLLGRVLNPTAIGWLVPASRAIIAILSAGNRWHSSNVTRPQKWLTDNNWFDQYVPLVRDSLHVFWCVYLWQARPTGTHRFIDRPQSFVVFHLFCESVVVDFIFVHRNRRLPHSTCVTHVSWLDSTHTHSNT